MGNHARRPHGLERILRAQRIAPSISPTRCRAHAPDSIRRRSAREGGNSAATDSCRTSSTRAIKWLDRVPLRAEFGEAFPDEQFPMQAVDELYKQMIPDLNSMLARAEPRRGRTWRRWRRS